MFCAEYQHAKHQLRMNLGMTSYPDLTQAASIFQLRVDHGSLNTRAVFVMLRFVGGKFLLFSTARVVVEQGDMTTTA